MTKTLASVCTNLFIDIRYALRGLRNAPGYAITVVLTLALGLGAVSTMLAIVDSVLLRPVSLPHPERLVMISVKGVHDGPTHALSYKQIDALRRNSHSFAAVSGYNTMVRPVGTADGNRTALLTEVTPQFFNMLSIHAKFGRLLSSADEKSPVAVVNSEFWQERLHRDPKAIGSTIKLFGQLRTVIGVLPENIHFPQGTAAPTIFTPITLNAKGEDDLFGSSIMGMARMKSGVSTQQALAEARSIFANSAPANTADRQTLEFQSYEQFLTGGVETSLLALLGGVGVLLLIACANAANLQIARATGRIAEIEVRSALGASFGRLLQQVVTESVVVSLLGAALGGALAYALVALIRSAYGQQFSRFDELAVHPVVFAACALLAVLVGVLVALAPMLNIRRQTRIVLTTTRTTRRSRVPGMLVALQIALTCVLLVTSGLFVRTFRALQEVNLGFDPHNVTTLVLMPEDQHKDPEASRQTITRLLDRFQTLPGVQSATMQTSIPFSNYNVTLNGTTEVNGRAFHEGDTAFYSMVSSNFIHASGMHLIQGRGLLPQDDGNAAIVVLVNKAFLKKYLTGRDPIGAAVKFHREPGDKDSDALFTQGLTVVGVVENELQGGDLGAGYEPMVYLDYRQLPKSAMLGQIFSFVSEFAVRSTLPQAVLDKELRAATKQVAPDMTEMSLQPMEEAIANSLNQRRLALRLVTGFGAVALLLAAIGIYGVLAYSVAQRRREIGIRMALGSSRAEVIRMVARQAGFMVLAGLVLGAAGTWPAGRAVKSFLFGVKALDPWTLIAAAAILLLVCAIAAIVPAWRAAQIDPMEALRIE
jgi:putative ABC transport system permease protein